MASTKGPNIDKIDDMMEAAELLKDFGISGKGLKTLDEMKAKIKEHLRKNPAKDTGEVINTICFAAILYRLLK